MLTVSHHVRLQWWCTCESQCCVCMHSQYDLPQCLQAQVLSAQDEVLSNLASLDQQEAARAEAALSRWQVGFPVCFVLSLVLLNMRLF